MSPLQTWVCDTCHDEISDPGMANVIARRTGEDELGEWKIVHKGECDLGDRAGFIHSVALSEYLGADGLARLLSYLSLGPLIGSRSGRGVADLDEFVDLIRRTQTPWYEEARQHFGGQEVEEGLGDANEILPYMPAVLERIATGRLH